MSRERHTKVRVGRLWAVLAALCLAAIGPRPATAEESLCAEVKIEIAQQLTLERQAFDAHMRINNGLSEISLQNIDIDVSFEDGNGVTVLATSDPDDTNAFFYITLDSMENIDDISGGGTIPPETSADIHWLIIPSPGAGGQRADGTLYLVGATLSYSYSGRDEEIVVEPDSIYVKPMPRLALDYFLPTQVYGDDAFTDPIEPPVPFSLGLRVSNGGYGWAQSLTIDSAQPRIVDNQLGLLVGFRITGSEVNGEGAVSTLAVDFGNLEPGGFSVARWTMECSLSGEFTSFTNRFSHSDELGGELTSLIGAVRTHLMIHDVLVDLPGRDGVRDFLAEDGGTYRVYESEGVDSTATNLSAVATFVLTGGAGNRVEYRLDVPAVTGPLYVHVPYDNVDAAQVVSVVRADGKRLKAANAWFSKTRESGTDPWEHAFNLFDVNGGGTYTMIFSDESVLPHPPVLAYIGNHVTEIGEPLGLGFLVEATDPDGTVPELAVSRLPTGATFTTTSLSARVEGTFFWRPEEGQQGVYPMRFVASDGALADEETIRIYVGAAGEATNSAGIPESLADWYVALTNVEASATSAVVRLYWDAVPGVAYDLFTADAWYSDSVPWLRTTNMVASTGFAGYAFEPLSAPPDVRLYHVALPDDPVPTNRPWAVARTALPVGNTFVAQAVRTDGRLDGELGAMLAETLAGDDGGPADGLGDELYRLGTDGTWQVSYLDSAGRWRDADGAPATNALAAGEAVLMRRQGGDAGVAVLAGRVGNDGTQEAIVAPGWNLLSLSEGVTRTLSGALADRVGDPVGAAQAADADLVVYEDAGGALRSLMCVSGWGPAYEGKWVEVGTSTVRDPELVPGKALYYRRVASGGTMRVRF